MPADEEEGGNELDDERPGWVVGNLVGTSIMIMGLMGRKLMVMVMVMMKRRVRMRITTRLAEVMPLDTKAAEVETNIITIMHNNFSDSDF